MEEFKPLLDAVMSGNYYLAAALALVGLVALARKFGWPSWGRTDWGGSLFLFLASLGGAVATSLAAGAAPTLALLWMATKIAAGASGGYTLVKRLLAPALRALKSRLPSWAGLPLDLLLWVFDHAGNKAAEAKKRGEAAVAAKPAGGIESITGKPREVP